MTNRAPLLHRCAPVLCLWLVTYPPFLLPPFNQPFFAVRNPVAMPHWPGRNVRGSHDDAHCRGGRTRLASAARVGLVQNSGRCDSGPRTPLRGFHSHLSLVRRRPSLSPRLFLLSTQSPARPLFYVSLLLLFSPRRGCDCTHPIPCGTAAGPLPRHARLCIARRGAAQQFPRRGLERSRPLAQPGFLAPLPLSL